MGQPGLAAITGGSFTFKVLLLTFKALNNLAPPYLSQLIVPYNPTRNLRSASKHLLEVPNVRLKSYGGLEGYSPLLLSMYSNKTR